MEQGGSLVFLLSKLKFYLWVIGAALVATVTVYFRGRASGREELEYEIKDQRLEDMLSAKEVEEDVDQRSDDELARSARKWVRKSSGG
jgi:hypothetical protein